MGIIKKNKPVVSIKRGTTGVIRVYRGSVLKFDASGGDSGDEIKIEFDIYGRLTEKNNYDILGLYQSKRVSTLTDIYIDGVTPSEYAAAHTGTTWYDTSSMTTLMVPDNDLHHIKLVYSEETPSSYYLAASIKSYLINLTYQNVSESKMSNVLN